MKSDHPSKFSNLSNCKTEALKISGLQCCDAPRTDICTSKNRRYSNSTKRNITTKHKTKSFFLVCQLLVERFVKCASFTILAYFGVADKTLAVFATFLWQQSFANASDPGHKCTRKAKGMLPHTDRRRSIKEFESNCYV